MLLHSLGVHSVSQAHKPCEKECLKYEKKKGKQANKLEEKFEVLWNINTMQLQMLT